MKPQAFKELKTKRLILKPYVATFDCAKLLFDIISSNREFLKWMPWSNVQKPEQEFDFLRDAENGWKNKTSAEYAMHIADNNELIGTCSFFNINWDNETAEIGYWLNSKHAHKGFMSEAVKAISDEYLKIGFKRIVIKANKDNIASCKTAEKCGFEREGLMRSYIFNPSLNQREDIVLFAKTRE